MTTLKKEQWSGVVDGYAYTYFVEELSEAEVLSLGGSMLWRGGWKRNGSECCILEFETEPTTAQIEALA